MSEEFSASNKLGTMPVRKLVFNMSVPVIISMIVQALYNIIDSAFVGKYSDFGLRALSLAFPIQNLIVAVAVGIGVGSTALISRYLGEHKKEKAWNIASTGFLLSIFGFIICLLIGIFASGPFMATQSSSPEVVEFGRQYLSISLIFSFGMFLEILMERYLQSTGKTKLSMISQITGCVCNIILDPIMIFGLFGFPELGVRGAAIATVIGQIVAGFVAMFLNIKFNKEIRFNIKKIFTPRFVEMKNILAIGIPSMVINAIMSVVVLIFNGVLRMFSEDAVTAYGVFYKLISFVYMPVFGLNNGLIPIYSYNYGSKQFDRIFQTRRIAYISAIIFMATCTVLAEIFTPQLYSIFSATPAVMEIGLTATRIMAIGFVLAGIDILNATIFQSIGNPTHSLITMILRQLGIFLPLAFVFALTGNLTLVWFALPIAEAATLILSFYFMGKLNKKLKLSATDESTNA